MAHHQRQDDYYIMRQDREDLEWDAKDLGCGELLIGLKTRLANLNAGEIFKLRSTDVGVQEDLPAWCEMTGNKLIERVHPIYLIQKRSER